MIRSANQIVGSGPIGFYGTKEVVADVKELANSKTYVDNATLVVVVVVVVVLAYAEKLSLRAEHSPLTDTVGSA